MRALTAALRRLTRPRARQAPPAPTMRPARARELTRTWLDRSRERDTAAHRPATLDERSAQLRDGIGR